jgi:hypothetical protein
VTPQVLVEQERHAEVGERLLSHEAEPLLKLKSLPDSRLIEARLDQPVDGLVLLQDST